MSSLKRHLTLVPVTISCIVFAIGCSSRPKAAPVPLAPTQVRAATATSPASAATTAATGQAPVQVAVAQASVLARQGAAAPTVTAIDPCTLLTLAEAEAANDSGLADGTRNARGECEFVDAVTGRLVSVGAQRGPRVRNAFEIIRSSSSEGGTPVPGVGDKAFFGSNSLFALKGDVLLSVQLVGPDVVDGVAVHPRLIGLMHLALSRF